MLARSINVLVHSDASSDVPWHYAQNDEIITLSFPIHLRFTFKPPLKMHGLNEFTFNSNWLTKHSLLFESLQNALKI